MALHVVQAQHGSSVVVVAALVVLLPATAQLVLDHLVKRESTWRVCTSGHGTFFMSLTFCEN